MTVHVKIIDATAAHLRAFYPRQPKTCRAWAIVDGDSDSVLGICGFYRTSAGNVVFTEIGAELRRHPRQIVQAARHVMAAVQAKRLPVFAACDSSIEASERFLRHFGFSPLPNENGVFQWQA